MNTSIIPRWFMLAVALLIAGAAEGASPTPISRLPYTISKPGRYLVTKNLVGPLQLNGIIISANDVVLDLGGWTLTSNGDIPTALNACIYGADCRNVTIRNGTIRGYLSGITLNGAGGRSNLVEDVNVDGCTRYGIQVIGIGSSVRHNRVSQIGGSTVFPFDRAGIDVAGDGVQVTDNEVSDVAVDSSNTANRAYGIRLGSSRSGTISGNRILNSNLLFPFAASTIGISVGSSAFCIIAGNQISGYITGIDFVAGGGSDAHVFRDNTVQRAFTPYRGVNETLSTKGPNNYP